MKQEKRKPRCEIDCKLYGTLACELDGIIAFGYEEEGCYVCPMFTPWDEEEKEE